jgi:integrase/recombinase XerD
MQDFVLVSLFASTGLRPHEVAGLSFGDIDIDAFCLDHPVKGGWRKRTPLSQSLAAALTHWQAQRKDAVAQTAIFLNHRGHRAQVPWIQARIKHLGCCAGLDRALTPKMLRHTFGTHAADRNGRVLTKALMGHTTLRRTCAYLHLCPSVFRNIMQIHPYPQHIHRGKRRHATYRSAH